MMNRVALALIAWGLAALSCAWAGPVKSSPITNPTSPAITLDTVDLFIRLTPVVRRIEDETFLAIEDVHRARHVRRQKRLEFRLSDLERRLGEYTGLPLWHYQALKWAILDLHKTIFTIRKLKAERAELLQIWKIQLAHDSAPDEVFVARRQHIDDHVAHLEQILKKSPDAARVAVESRFDRIIAAFRRPPKPNRAERQELSERAAELLPPPPANPYREGFFDDFW